MRHAVRPPQHTQALAHPAGQAVGTLQQQVPVQTTVQPKLSSVAVDPMRARRAQAAGRSQSVEHFRPHRQTNSMDFRRLQPVAVPVQAQPQPQPYSHHAQPQAVPMQVHHSVQAPQPQPMQPQVHSQTHIPAAPTLLQPAQLQPRPYTQPILRRNAVPQQPAAQPQQPSEAAYEQDLFNKALASATSHEEPAPKESALKSLKRKGSKRKRVLGIVGSLAVFMILAGVIAYQNKSNIQLQIASAKAGFSAAAPLYKPEGFELDKLSYGTGSVAQVFRSESQSFTIRQKKSNWDSQTLLENFVSTTDEEYQGYQANGRTIYVYGNGNATWVNGGVWYQIKSTGLIPRDQLVKIASSI
jgi:hypothetical protein